MWKTEYRCANCQKTLTDGQVMYSSGRCPKCGIKGPNAGTIVETTEHAYRLVGGGRWWQFWKKPSRQYKEDMRNVFNIPGILNGRYKVIEVIIDSETPVLWPQDYIYLTEGLYPDVRWHRLDDTPHSNEVVEVAYQTSEGGTPVFATVFGYWNPECNLWVEDCKDGYEIHDPVMWRRKLPINFTCMGGPENAHEVIFEI